MTALVRESQLQVEAGYYGNAVEGAERIWGQRTQKGFGRLVRP